MSGCQVISPNSGPRRAEASSASTVRVVEPATVRKEHSLECVGIAGTWTLASNHHACLRRCLLLLLSTRILITPTLGWAQGHGQPRIEHTVVLSVHRALNEVLRNATAGQIQRLDLQVLTAQAKLASRAFLPQGTLRAQLERAASDGSGTRTATRSATDGIEGSWLLRSGTMLTASYGRSAIRSPSPTVLGASTSSTVTLSSIGLVQPLLRGFGSEVATVGEQQALLGLSGAQQSFKQAMSDLVLACVALYFGVEQARRNVGLARAAVDRAVEMLEVNRSLLEAGRIARTALLQTEADRAQAEFGLAQARQAEAVAERQLMHVVGMKESSLDGKLLELSDSFETYLTAPALDEGTVVQQALTRRVDLLSSRYNLESSRLALIAARDGLRNQLDLYVKVDHQTSVVAAPAATTSRAIGLSLTIPLDKSDRRVAADAAQVEVTKAELSVAETERTARAEIHDAIKAIEFSHRQYQLAKRAAELAGQRLADEVDKARVGRSSATDLSFAQDALRQAQSQEVQARYVIFTTQLELQRVTGTVLEQWQADGAVRDMMQRAER